MKKNGEIYYPNLEIEIIKHKVTKTEIAKKLEIDYSSFAHKLNGVRPFTLEQGLVIWKTWFEEIPIDELFHHEEEQP